MRSVEATCFVNAAPDVVLAEFLDLEGMKVWWTADRGLIVPQVGGVWVVAWNVSEAGARFLASGTVSSYEPGRTLEIGNYIYFNPEYPIFGPMTLTFSVSENEAGTELHVRQDGYQHGDAWNWYYEAVTQAWPIVLKAFSEYIDEKKRSL